MKIIRDIAVSENGLIFNPITGDSFKINPIGMEIFNSIRNNIDISEIIESILEKYDIDKNTLDVDINDFFNSMSRNRLIEGETRYFDIGD
jgi:hypothetical protein